MQALNAGVPYIGANVDKQLGPGKDRPLTSTGRRSGMACYDHNSQAKFVFGAKCA
jgi:hypothetical protein